MHYIWIDISLNPKRSLKTSLPITGIEGEIAIYSNLLQLLKAESKIVITNERISIFLIDE